MFGGVFRGRRVLVTGHHGFKGAWLSLWLRELGAEVHGLALPLPPSPTLHEVLPAGLHASEQVCDIRDADALAAAVRRVSPDAVFHFAAQALVRRSYREPRLTFETNALGTLHLLEAVHQAGVPGPVVIATTDKCYENLEEGRPFRVGDPLGGRDPYSMSKAAAELVTASYCASFLGAGAGPPVATVRAGNVVGGGDYGEDRLLPDVVRAQVRNEDVAVRNPRSVRPWQHVLDCLSGYLRVGQALAEGGLPDETRAFNIGPAAGARLTVKQVLETFFASWPGRWRDESDAEGLNEAAHLELDISATEEELGWSPAWSAERAIAETAAWYRARHEEKRDDLGDLCLNQLEGWAADAPAGTRGEA